MHVSNRYVVYFQVTQIIGQLCLNKAGNIKKTQKHITTKKIYI